MHESQVSPKVPFGLRELLHGLSGALAGLLLGWLTTTQLPPLVLWLKVAFLVAFAFLGAALAFRFGGAFWRALMDSLAEASE